MKKIKLHGFTLVELLVVMAIIALFGGAIVSILFSLFRGASKTNTIITLRQTGNYAVDQVTRIVREAKSLDNPTTDDCDGSPITSNTIDLTTQDVDLNLQTTSLSCAGGNLTSTTNGSPRTLIDGTKVGVSCNFSCTIDTVSQIPVITFSLSIFQKNDMANTENSGKLDYSTSILMRNAQ